MSQVAVLRNGLREVVRELQESQNKLVGLRRAIPPLPPERPEDHRDAEPDPLAEMGAVIECGLHDCLEPLIRDLVGAAEYQAKSPRRGQPLGEIDLRQSDDATRQALHELVKKDNFLGEQTGDGDAWVPPYTAEDAQLRVFHLHGRWFATWLKLEEPGEAPEAERRELLLLEESEENPGFLLYREV
jgi:hypothetical protein